jgi:hypothetical protein
MSFETAPLRLCCATFLTPVSVDEALLRKLLMSLFDAENVNINNMQVLPPEKAEPGVSFVGELKAAQPDPSTERKVLPSLNDTPTRAKTARQILALMADRREHTIGEIRKSVTGTTTPVIRTLVEEGKLVRSGIGIYCLPGAVEPKSEVMDEVAAEIPGAPVLVRPMIPITLPAEAHEAATASATKSIVKDKPAAAEGISKVTARVPKKTVAKPKPETIKAIKTRKTPQTKKVQPVKKTAAKVDEVKPVKTFQTQAQKTTDLWIPEIEVIPSSEHNPLPEQIVKSTSIASTVLEPVLLNGKLKRPILKLNLPEYIF